MCAAWVEVPLYACRRRRWALLGQCLATEGAYLAAACLLWRWNAVATLWVLALPYLVSSLALMFGNWCGLVLCAPLAVLQLSKAVRRSQHIFLHPCQNGSAYRLTYSCVGHAANQRTGNDGYHIQHHLNSRLHWSELPGKLLATLPQHAEESGAANRRVLAAS